MWKSEFGFVSSCDFGAKHVGRTARTGAGSIGDWVDTNKKDQDLIKKSRKRKFRQTKIKKKFLKKYFFFLL